MGEIKFIGYPEASLYEGYYLGSQRLVDASNHSMVMDAGNYGSTSAVVDREIHGDSKPAWQWPQIWAAGNQGLYPSNGNDVGYYSMYAPAKNSIAVGSVNANSEKQECRNEPVFHESVYGE